VLKYDYERWSKEATLAMFGDLVQGDAESLRQLLLDAIRDADFLKIDLSLVKLIAPACGEVLFSFTDENRDISKRLLIFRRRSMNGSSVVDNGN